MAAPAVAEPISLTEPAIQQIKKILKKNEGKGFIGLRLAVRGGGCSGLNYEMDLDTEATEMDETYFIGGIQVIVDRKSLRYLAGTTLDYTGDLMSGGFQFDNPNAVRTCGCGTSFTPK